MAANPVLAESFVDVNGLTFGITKVFYGAVSDTMTVAQSAQSVAVISPSGDTAPDGVLGTVSTTTFLRTVTLGDNTTGTVQKNVYIISFHGSAGVGGHSATAVTP